MVDIICALYKEKQQIKILYPRFIKILAIKLVLQKPLQELLRNLGLRLLEVRCSYGLFDLSRCLNSEFNI